MRAPSLTLRVLVGAVIWVAIALGAGSYAVLDVFGTSALRQFDERLRAELTLLSVAVVRAPDAPQRMMTSPNFSRVYSGLYWQADRPNQASLRSRSLWDQRLVISPPGHQMTPSMAEGPDGQSLRILARRVTALDGSDWTIAVAADLATLEQETELFQRGLLPAAAWLAGALVLAAILLLRSALGPLGRLRRAVRSLTSREDGEITASFPSEVAPLVDDLNTMLERNTVLRDRGRARAANLAHALKTPAAILQNEIDRAKAGGQIDLTLAAEAVARISGAAESHAHQVSAGSEGLQTGERHDAVQHLSEVARAITRLFPDLDLQLDLPGEMMVAVQSADLQEVFGNLLENAGKWAKAVVNVTLSQQGSSMVLSVDDDGPGIAPQDRQKVLRQGIRLDQAKPGSGLGLGIVDDLVDRYGGELVLDQADLGGLRVQVLLPIAPR